MSTRCQSETNGGDAVIEVLREYGIDYLFTSPIAALAPLWEAFAKKEEREPESFPKYANCRHELAAVGLAIGYYKSTGKMAAVCLPTGLGVLNGSMALRQARQERIPMVVISPDTLTFGEDSTKDPGPEWPFFLIDDHGPAAHAKTTTKWAIACRTNGDLYPNLNRAIYFAQQIPRGPTMVEIPFDVLMSPFDDIPNRFTKIESRNLVSDPDNLGDVVDIIAKAQNPVIITEHFGANPHAIAVLQDFAETVAAPVFEAWMPAYGNFDRSHPLHGGGYVEEVLGDADVIISASSHGPWHSPDQKFKAGAVVIVLEEDPLRPRSAYWGYQTSHCVSGDPCSNLKTITNKLKADHPKLDTKARLERWTAYNAKKKSAFVESTLAEARVAFKQDKVHASVFFKALASALPRQAIIVDEMVSQVPNFTHFLFQDKTKEFKHCRGWQGGLGTGLSVALGCKLGNPDKTVVCIIGDGAFNYNPIPACFGFSNQYKCPIIVAVMNNEGYISQTWNFHKYYPSGSALTTKNTYGSVINPTPNYAELPLAWGGIGIQVQTEKDIASA
eukprot:CAMPEP_0203756714 /NCGR_PEP_ID=MMETSP0098-20131031/9935_1 /ASSEMBLY_ACC=CAM_ASM_000208 /TAXON_ID=96639 /ORGANISM=" , Strain NY0313808BC1" /LENGTH=556 /DNA_ID=CAMNT_0050648689 /DNA_START=111 /DNA_END=1778 /DNA_ORIENTATION=-